MQVKVVFEDIELLVLDKPAGMVVNRSDTVKEEETLQDWVQKYLKIPSSILLSSKQHGSNYDEQSKIDFVNRAGIVHRLDKETSGIILVAKTFEAFKNLQSQFKERNVRKTYIALAHGKIEPEIGTIDVEVGRLPWNRKRFGVLSGGRGSVTQYKVLDIKYLATGKIREPLSLVELTPKTGRTHQIRVHLQYIHHPIFADPLYAGRKTSRNDRKLLPRVFLHASKISFFHPKNNKILNFESLLPQELKDFRNSLTII
jgi:23S rRNA pseudouridine1911/1915/1917 synthase